jgi:hypothetical protein
MTRAFNGVLANEKSSDTRRLTSWRYGAPRFSLQWANGRFLNATITIILSEAGRACLLTE